MTSVAGSAEVAMTWVSFESKPGAVNRRSGLSPDLAASGSFSVLMTTVSVSASRGIRG